MKNPTCSYAIWSLLFANVTIMPSQMVGFFFLVIKFILDSPTYSSPFFLSRFLFKTAFHFDSFFFLLLFFSLFLILARRNSFCEQVSVNLEIAIQFLFVL